MNVLKSDPLWLKEAFRDLGLKEIKGKKHNPRVVEMFAESGSPWVIDDETAWCAAAMGSWLKRAGLKGTGSLAARSYLKWGKKINKPKRGCVVVFKRGNSSWQGHVALFLRFDGNKIEVIGGNQRDAVNVASYPKSKLLGYRKPSTVNNSKVIKVVTASVLGTGFSLTDLASYIPDAFSLVQNVNPTYLIIGAGVIVAAVSTFLIWDRIMKIRNSGV